MQKVRTVIDRSIQLVCCFLFMVMVVTASWQVISRYILNSPSTTSEAFLRCSLIWLSMLAIAYVAGRREHVSLTLFTDKLTGSWKMASDLLTELLFIVFSIFIMIHGGFHAASNTMSQLYPMLNIPKGLIYLSLPVSGCIIVAYSIINCLKIIQNSQTIRSQ
ncbi:TRAP transporter small permease [Halomonas elongata]|uniref:TRAP transporter small permease protein n=1 Tax=Halomonas elongata (strain ATCC 33173 / DSM 2581 / NBRC 15536 / NCIMB 2198 / 1H9) TaxID=768066 RepID=A0A1R4A4E2_HALED|nr:TRAP transporter small permease [Halomonas elongata]WBF16591.1 TRAP transporter small permease [Halomonas elongata]WPU49032.1 TRAP transporter small permease [Halomonas elongata DSM 2581]SJK83831.1 TRAP transporter small transmembrane protein [Halomonas elongata DSM 2581]